ncbi:response regulator [Rhodobacter sp. NSM]|uniref:response regulator n=1 Tax=Rhodobacter sp. NSM TaxID=3457501 RepID=UPI003FD4307B
MAPTILIVDDSKLARIVLGKTVAALQPDWLRVEAGDATDASAILATQKIDVVLIDYNMPGKDGLDLAAELRAQHPKLPIAIITANVQNDVVTRVQAVDAALVQKPVSEDGLRGFLTGAALYLKREHTL